MIRTSEALFFIGWFVIGMAFTLALTKIVPPSVPAPNAAPICPAYTDREFRFEDGSLACMSGDGDIIIWDPSLKEFISPSIEQEILPN